MSSGVEATPRLRGVAQMGARVVWDHEVAGSSPVTPTTCGCSSVVER